MYKKWSVITCLLLLAMSLTAQQEEVMEGDTSRWDFHLSTGTSFVSGWGKSIAFLWTAPSVEYRANDRLTIRGGFAYAGSLLNGYQLQGYTYNYAPRRNGTRLAAAKVEADYWVNDRLNIWASVTRIGGWHEPLWTPRGEALGVDVTMVSGGFSYELSNSSLLEMHFHFVHDHYGNSALGLLGHPYYGWGVPSYELYAGPWPF